jgi:hypothetical protein
MYYIDRPHQEPRFTTISSRVQDGENYRRQRPLEPIERKYYPEPEPTVARKVYKKLPDNRQRENPNGNNLRLVRKVEKIYPAPGTYNPNPSLYHLRARDEY